MTYLLDLLDLDVIQVFMTYMDASRYFFFFFLVCQVAGGFELVGMILQCLFNRLLNALREGAVTTEFGSAFQLSTTLIEKQFFSNIESSPMLEKPRVFVYVDIVNSFSFSILSIS